MRRWRTSISCSRSWNDFLEDIQSVFNRLVDLTGPICQAIGPSKAGMTIFDSSGIEAWVTENNPKYANRVIKQLKAYAKAMHFDDSYDPFLNRLAGWAFHGLSKSSTSFQRIRRSAYRGGALGGSMTSS